MWSPNFWFIQTIEIQDLNPNKRVPLHLWDWWVVGRRQREQQKQKWKASIKIKVEQAKGKKEKFFRQSPYLLDIIMNMLFYLLVD